MTKKSAQTARNGLGNGNPPIKRRLKAAILLLVLIAAIIGIRLSGQAGYFTLENLKQHQAQLEQVVYEHYRLAVVCYIGLYTASTALAVPGATILTLAGGLLFHTFPGIIYVNIGATTGAVLAFIFSRYIFGTWFQQRYSSRLRSFNEDIEKNGYFYLLFVRLIPAFPFFVINVLSGLTTVPLSIFVWTTAVGILPGSLVYTYAGNQVGTLASSKDVVSGRVFLAFFLVALLAILPVIVKKLQSPRGS
jgi:uncharacterized membrane protein YdjX (TVP38/TMEM64 family)